MSVTETKTFRLSPVVFFSLLLSGVLLSCHPLKKANVRKPLSETKPEVLVQKMDSARFRANWLALKMSASFEAGGESNSFSASVRLRKDSVLWVSISALGIEAARILVTKDSVKLLDRLNSKYMLASFDYLNSTFQLALDFEMLEDMICGNYFSYLDASKLRSSYIDESLFILSTLRRRKLKREMEDKEPNKRIIQDVWLDPSSYRIVRFSVDDNKLQKKLIAAYENYQDITSETDTAIQTFPHKVSLKIESDKPAKLEYEVTKVTLDKEQEFPFSIPDKYERMK